MKVKKNNIQTWPPDTEVMESDNTYVSAPALTFLTNQLLNQPLTIESQQQDANLAALGIDGPSLRNQTLRDAIKKENFLAQQEEQKIQRLMSAGHTRDSAIEFLRESQMYGRIESVAPLVEFLSPVGDVIAMGQALALGAQGHLSEAATLGGLATASIFMPGTIRADAMADDMVRLGARRNVDRGAMPSESLDLLEYIQETATPGDIAYGAVRSEAAGGGARALSEDVFSQINFARPIAGQSPAEIAFSGRSLGEALASNNSISKEALDATVDYINAVLGSVNDDMRRYYQGIITGIKQPGLANAPKFEQVSIGSLGNRDITYNIDRTAPVENGGDLIRMQTAPGSPFDLKMYAIKEGGDVGYDFHLSASTRDIKNSRAYKSRVKELTKEGMSKDVAEQTAMKETRSAINSGLEKMYSEIAVGENVFTASYSTDSYPLMLNNLSRGKYMVMEDAAEIAVRNQPLNAGGSNLTLFRKMRLDFDLPSDRVDIVNSVRSNSTFQARVAQDAEKRLKGVERTPSSIAKAKADAEKYVLLRGTRDYNYGKEMGLSKDQIEMLGDSFVTHINKQINVANDRSFDRLVRQRADEDLIDLQDAQSEILEEFIELPQATFKDGVYTVPTPRILKVRAEKGAYIKSNMKAKKKASYGMRVKK